jgi:hypothetical protein
MHFAFIPKNVSIIYTSRDENDVTKMVSSTVIDC